MRLSYPTNIKIVKLPCTGKIDVLYLLKAFQNGADGVYVAGCMEGDCHYLTGNYRARRRIAIAKKFLEYMGIEPERVQASWVSASEGAKWAEVVTEVTNDLKKLGPNHLFDDERSGTKATN